MKTLQTLLTIGNTYVDARGKRTDFLHDYLDKLNDNQWLEVYKDYNRSFNY